MKSSTRFPVLLASSFLSFLVHAQANTTNFVAFGVVTNGSIPMPGWTNSYVFNAASNDVIFVAVRNVSGGALPYLVLYDSSGEIVTTHYNSRDSAILRHYPLPKADTFTLAVSDDFSDQAFDYFFSLSVAKGGGANTREPGDSPEALVPGQIATGHLSLADYDTYTFHALSNDVVFIALFDSGGARLPYIFLYDSEGTVVAAHYDSSSFAALRDVRLTKTDTYTLAVTEDGFDHEWDYTLSINLVKGGGANTREPGDSPEALVPGQIANGHMSLADYDTYTFHALSNDVAFIALFNPGGARLPYIFLYDSEGTVVAAHYDSASFAALKDVRLLKTDTYTLAVTEDGFDHEWDYTLSINLVKGGETNQREPEDGPEALQPGLVTSGRISFADYDTYTFTASSNDVIFLTVFSPGGARYPYLRLYDSTGSQLTTQYNSANYAILDNLRLTQTDTYTLAVAEDAFNYEFNYTVCLIKQTGTNYAEAGDAPSLLVPFQSAAAQITMGDLDAFAFRAIAGDTISLLMQRVSGAQLNPWLQVMAPDGTVLDSQSGSDPARITLPCVAQTGTYLAVVSNSQFNGPFGYSLSLSQSPLVPPSSGEVQYLAIYLCMTNVMLRWETNATDFILESRIPPAANWFPVNRVPQIMAEHYYVDDGPATNTSQFYRLRCTNCPPTSFATPSRF